MKNGDSLAEDESSSAGKRRKRMIKKFLTAVSDFKKNEIEKTEEDPENSCLFTLKKVIKATA